jgi:hypothetical protein
VHGNKRNVRGESVEKTGTKRLARYRTDIERHSGHVSLGWKQNATAEAWSESRRYTSRGGSLRVVGFSALSLRAGRYTARTWGGALRRRVAKRPKKSEYTENQRRLGLGEPESQAATWKMDRRPSLDIARTCKRHSGARIARLVAGQPQKPWSESRRYASRVKLGVSWCSSAWRASRRSGRTKKGDRGSWPGHILRAPARLWGGGLETAGTRRDQKATRAWETRVAGGPDERQATVARYRTDMERHSGARIARLVAWQPQKPRSESRRYASRGK